MTVVARTPVRSLMTRFSKTSHGIAAVEFSFCLPIILGFFFSALAFYDAHRAQQLYGYAATVAVDLVTRQDTLSPAARDEVFGVARAIARQYGDRDDFTVRIASVSTPPGEDSEATMDWSFSSREQDVLTLDQLKALSLPTIPAGQSVVIAVVSATYEPLFMGAAGFDPLRFESVAVRRPRFVPQIVFDEAG